MTTNIVVWPSTLGPAFLKWVFYSGLHKTEIKDQPDWVLIHRLLGRAFKLCFQVSALKLIQVIGRIQFLDNYRTRLSFPVMAPSSLSQRITSFSGCKYLSSSFTTSQGNSSGFRSSFHYTG